MTSDRFQRRIERLLDQIDEAADQRDWQKVRQLSEDVLLADSENSDAINFRDMAERALGVIPETVPSTPQPSSAPTEPQTIPASAPDAERRQLTVMFCDLQGSTALSQQLDPEILRDVIRGYQEVCAGAVGRFEGHIAKYLGDGLLVYFGYPQAHEDDPQRAVRAGLAILQDMNPLNARLKSEKDLELTVRIGIHTGLVVAGEMGGGDTLEELAIVGETPNIAARIEGAAEPNGIAISDVTANLVQGFFVCETMGPHELKGISDPVELFRVLEESGAQTRFDVASTAELTPLVGRDQELGLLLDRWEQAQEGLGQVVLLSGEAGIGKSRLIDALTERLAAEPHTLRWLRCSAYHRNSALHPFIEYSESLLGIDRKDSAEERLSKLKNALSKVDFPLAEAVPLLSGVLSIPLTERFPELAMSPEWQRERTLELLVSMLLDSAEEHPVFIVVEDLHWADPSTQAVLRLLIEQVPTMNVLALLSFRPEFTPPWSARAYVTPISLNRLTRRLATDMVDRLTGGKTLPEEIITQVASKSDGVPLFVEELVRMVVESDLIRETDDHYELTGPLPPLAIPSTLQDSLTARLDRLGDAREVAQMGAVLGREFTYEILQAISPLESETLSSHLQSLIDAEFLYLRGLPPEATYTFKHTMIQDAAYQSLLHSVRQQYHQQTVQALEDGFASIVETQPELLAYHFVEAGLIERSVSYWLTAGGRALAAYAHEEAVGFFTQGLGAKGLEVDGLTPAQDEEAAELLFGLARAQSATFERHRIGEVFGTLSRAFQYYAEAGNVAQAVATAGFPIAPAGVLIPGLTQLLARALTLVPDDSHEAGRLLSRYGGILGAAEGDYEGAQQAMKKAIAIARREGDTPLELQTETNSCDVSGRNLNWRESIDHGVRAIGLLTGDENPYYEVLSRYFTALGFLHIGDPEGSRPHALALLELTERRVTGVLASLCFGPTIYLSCLLGDWNTARETSDRGLEEASLDPLLLLPRVLLEHESGEAAQGETHLNRLFEAARRSAVGQMRASGRVAIAIATIARITGVSDRLGIAESAADVILSNPTVLPQDAMHAKAGLALVAVLKEDKSAAKEHHGFLLGKRGTMTSSVASVDRLLGLLAQTMGDPDQAATHFEEALAFCRMAGYRPELAWAYCDYADTLLARNGEEDRTKAKSLLDDSLAISGELGMRPLMERVLSRQEKLKE